MSNNPLFTEIEIMSMLGAHGCIAPLGSDFLRGLTDTINERLAPAEPVGLREALEKCRDQFQFYATEHKTKSDAAYKVWDNARYWGNVDEQNAAHKEYHKRLTQTQTNEAMVAMIDAALTATPATPADAASEGEK